jgi:hypothetical protein
MGSHPERQVVSAHLRLSSNVLVLIRASAADPDCSNVGNDVLTCYPNGTTTLVQDEWSKVIFNSKSAIM